MDAWGRRSSRLVLIPGDNPTCGRWDEKRAMRASWVTGIDTSAQVGRAEKTTSAPRIQMKAWSCRSGSDSFPEPEMPIFFRKGMLR